MTTKPFDAVFADWQTQARQELDRLSRLPSAAAEYGVIRTYLDWMVTLPWSKTTEDKLDIPHAREILNADHYGLEDVKDRILEFLAVRKLRLDRKDEAREPSTDQIRREREGVILTSRATSARSRCRTRACRPK